MKKYHYERIMSEPDSGICHILAPYDLADWSGPAIEFMPHINMTLLTVRNEAGSPILIICLNNNEESRFVIDLWTSEENEKPSIRTNGKTLFFGMYQNGKSFQGPVYKITKLEGVAVGNLSELEIGERSQIVTPSIIEEEVVVPLRFQCSANLSALCHRKKEMVGGWVDLYVVGDPDANESTMAAVIESSGKSYVGQWSGGAFNGLVLSSAQGVHSLRYYTNGSPDDSFRFTCVPEIDGFSWMVKRNDGTYTDIVYDRDPDTSERTLRLLHLNQRQKGIKKDEINITKGLMKTSSSPKGKRNLPKA